MTMTEGPTDFVLFRDAADGVDFDPPRSSGLDHVSPWYVKAREQAERAAAKRATSVAARRVHQELAQSYARQLETMRGGS